MATNIQNFLTVPVTYYDTGKLDAGEIRALKPREKIYRLSDGRGLYLQVNPNGSKWWRLAYRFAGKQKTISMGVWPDTNLEQARRAMSEAKALIREGMDPSAVRQASRGAQLDAEQNTFASVTAAWIARSAPEWSEATLVQTQSRLDRNVLPYLGNWPIRELTAPVILKTVQRIVDRGAVETARRVMRIIRQICAFAVITGRLDTNPATDLAQALPTVKTKHMPALTTPNEVGGLLRALYAYEGEATVRAALNLAPLLFVRPGELRGARWPEIDLDSAVWEIPPERMKMGDPLIVPLAEQAVEILADLKPLTGRGAFVFPGARSQTRPISDNTLNAALRRLGYTKDQMTAHGFRAMARTMLEEQLGFRYELIEQQLGHVVRDPNGRAYNRTKNLADRSRMMQAWADYLERLRDGGGNVAELRATP